MFQSIITKLAIYALKGKKLTDTHRTELMCAILSNLSALPIKDVIRYADNGSIIVRGRVLEPDQISLLRESADALKNNFVRKLIDEQITYEAIKYGVNQGLTPESIQFSKAMLWWGEQQNALINQLSLK